MKWNSKEGLGYDGKGQKKRHKEHSDTRFVQIAETKKEFMRFPSALLRNDGNA